MPQSLRSFAFVLTATLLCLGSIASATSPPKPDAQLVTELPGTLFNNTLPEEQFRPLCDAAAATARASDLTPQELTARVASEGGMVRMLYAEPGKAVKVQLSTPVSSVYNKCYRQAQWMDRFKMTGPVDVTPTGDVSLYIFNTGRTELNSFAETTVKMLFLDKAGMLIREIEPEASKEMGKPQAPEGTVTSWPADFWARFSDGRTSADLLAPDFARASVLRIDFTQDGARQVLDFKIVRP